MVDAFTKNNNNTTHSLIDVLVLTYNQEKYIAEAIESVLMQKTDFNFRIIIGDDCSTDRTREICIDYKEKYPDKIELVFHKQNFGAVKNFYITYQSCNAKYLAMLDGDDYWTSPIKLQKQIDFLENNGDYSACFHQVTQLNLNNNETKIIPVNIKKSNLEIEDIIALPTTGWIINTSSLVFRIQSLGILPKWFIKFNLGDWTLVLLSSINGKTFFLNEVMSTYRINSGGLMQSIQFANHKVIYTLLKIFKEFNSYTNYKFRNLIYIQLRYFLYQLILHYKNKKKWIICYYYTIEYNYYFIYLNHKKPVSVKQYVIVCLEWIRFLFRQVKTE